jgi:two-component system OmpR family response regulator
MNTNQPATVLLVEDDDALALFFTRALRRAGHHVEVALRGDEGLRLALSGRFDVMVLDWHLPGLDGHTVLSAIRAAKIPVNVLMLTGYGDTHRDSALTAGADAFLEKPCGLEELVAAVDAFLKPQIACAA